MISGKDNETRFDPWISFTLYATHYVSRQGKI